MDRKQLILEAATKSFTLFGYKATTMDQVAKIANVGKGTIYTFYKNKEELFQEIVQSVIQEMKEKAEGTLTNDETFQERVHKVLYELLHYRTQHQLLIKLSQEETEMRTPAVKEMVREIETAIIYYIEEKVKVAITDKEIEPCNPKLTAFLLLKIYVSLVFDWEQQNEPLSKEEIAQVLEMYLFKGLST